MTLVVLGVILICTIATITEIYKKVIRSSNFKSWEVWVIVVILSIGSSYFLYLLNDLEMGKVCMIMYSIILCTSQYLVDMEIVKRVFNKVIENNTNKI